jgi:hypothetical protein
VLAQPRSARYHVGVRRRGCRAPRTLLVPNPRLPNPRRDSWLRPAGGWGRCSSPREDDAVDIVFWFGELIALTAVVAMMVRLIRAEIRNGQPDAAASQARARRRGAPWLGCRASGGPRAQPAPPPAAAGGADPAAQWAPFVVRPDTDLVELQRQYRRLACSHHPDRGGDPRVMAQINLMYRQLRRQQSAR